MSLANGASRAALIAGMRVHTGNEDFRYAVGNPTFVVTCHIIERTSATIGDCECFMLPPDPMRRAYV